MPFRDDLDAAHARIASLEAELARVKAECETLRRRLRGEVEPEPEFSEQRLREKMRREELEVEEKIRRILEENREPSPWRGDE